MSHAEICPVCKSRGYLNEVGFIGKVDPATETICHGCNGKGWIELKDEAVPFMSYIPSYPTPLPEPITTWYPTYSGDMKDGELNYIVPVTTGEG